MTKPPNTALDPLHPQAGTHALLTPLARGLAAAHPSPLSAPSLAAISTQARRWAFRLMFIALLDAAPSTPPARDVSILQNLINADGEELLPQVLAWLNHTPRVSPAEPDPTPPPDALREALQALQQIPRDDWAELESRALGALYEALLEVHLTQEGGELCWRRAAGHARKTSGSYYTPDILVQRLLDNTLGPPLTAALQARDPVQAVLALRVCDPSCGAGDFLVAAGHRLTEALNTAHQRQRGADAPPSTIAALWTSCLYGVDLSPVAIAIAQLALQRGAARHGAQVASMDLSARFKVGNALIGAPHPNPSRPPPQTSIQPLAGDDPEQAKDQKQRARRALASCSLPTSHTSSDALIADAWCAAFLWPRKADAPPSPHEVWGKLLRASPDAQQTAATIEALRRQYGFVHWALTFPEVFKPTRAGFDVIIGNPPWERLKLQEREFFASHAPDIAAAGKAAARRQRIQGLRSRDPALHHLYMRAKRRAEGQLHFARRSGRYPLCGRGDINAYALFTELSQSLIRPEGVVGLVVPSGIATDRDTRRFFKALIDERRLTHLHHFDNRARLFQHVGAMITFCMLTFTRRQHPLDHRADFVFFAHHPDDLDQPDRHIGLDAADIASLNPNTHTCPIFTHQRDAALTLDVYKRFPILDDRTRGDNPWGLRLSTLFHMTNDSHRFITGAHREVAHSGLKGYDNVNADDSRLWPLWEAKMIHHYDHRFGDFRDLPKGHRGARLPSPTLTRRDDPHYEPVGRYWVTEDDLQAAWPASWHRRWLIAWRDVCRSTDERTVIAAAMPPTAAGNTLTVSQIDRSSLAACFVACASSLALDTIARFKVGGAHLNFFILRQLPFPPPQRFSQAAPWTHGAPLGQWVTPRAVALIHTTHSLDPFARDCGADGPPERWDAQKRAALRAQLDAAFFHIYGFTRPQVVRALESFEVLKRREQATCGHYETALRVLRDYDLMATRGAP